MPSPLPPFGEHVAAFHMSDDFIVSQIARFVEDGLRADEQVVVVATLAHWNAVTERLRSRAVEYGRAAAQGRLVIVEADHVLDAVSVDGAVDVGAFRALLEPLIRSGRRLRLYGEVVSLLANQGDLDGALAVEALGQELSRSAGVKILCGYHVNGSRPLAEAEIARYEAAHDHSIVEKSTQRWAGSTQSACHAVRFYQSADSLARIVSEFLGAGFDAELPAIVIATPDHRRAIVASLLARDIDVRRLENHGDLMFADAEGLLETFMVEGMPDADLFQTALIPLIERAGRGRRNCVVRAYGEMVDVLWRAGHTVAAVKLETLWNQLAHTHAFSLLCAYSMGHFYKDASAREIHALHTHVSSDDSRLANASH